MPLGIAEAARRRGRCPRGCSRRRRRSAAQPRARPAPSRSRPRRRRSRAPRRPARSARRRRASRRPARPRGPHSRAWRPRRRWSSRPPGTRPRPPPSPWRHPRRSEAGGARQAGAATAAGRTGSAARCPVRGSCDEPTPEPGRGARAPGDLSPAILRCAHARPRPAITGVARPCQRARRAGATRRGSTCGPEPCAAPPRRGRSGQDGPVAAPVGGRRGMPDRLGGRRRVRDGARHSPACMRCAPRCSAVSGICRARSATR